jgi:uncharacterized protein (TIGR03437 family)
LVYIEYEQAPTTESLELRFGSNAAKVLSVDRSRITAIVPSSLEPGLLEATIGDLKGKRASSQVEIAALAPAIVGALENENGSSNTRESPAIRGTFVTVYVTGEGN